MCMVQGLGSFELEDSRLSAKGFNPKMENPNTQILNPNARNPKP